MSDPSDHFSSIVDWKQDLSLVIHITRYIVSQDECHFSYPSHTPKNTHDLKRRLKRPASDMTRQHKRLFLFTVIWIKGERISCYCLSEAGNPSGLGYTRACHMEPLSLVGWIRITSKFEGENAAWRHHNINRTISEGAFVKKEKKKKISRREEWKYVSEEVKSARASKRGVCTSYYTTLSTDVQGAYSVFRTEYSMPKGQSEPIYPQCTNEWISSRAARPITQALRTFVTR